MSELMCHYGFFTLGKFPAWTSKGPKNKL